MNQIATSPRFIKETNSAGNVCVRVILLSDTQLDKCKIQLDKCKIFVMRYIVREYFTAPDNSVYPGVADYFLPCNYQDKPELAFTKAFQCWYERTLTLSKRHPVDISDPGFFLPSNAFNALLKRAQGILVETGNSGLTDLSPIINQCTGLREKP